MAKQMLVIDKTEFQNVINDLEANNTFSKLSELWTAVCNTEWAKSQNPRPLTPQVAITRAKELNIQIKTKPGKRGTGGLSILKGVKLTEEQKIAMKNGRNKKKKGTYKSHFDKLRATTPQMYQLLVDKMENGSRTAKDKLYCLKCVGYDKKEVRYCTAEGSCPNWHVRPYQKSENEDDDDETEQLNQLITNTPIIDDFVEE